MTRVVWVGHSTVLIETAGRRLVTDPVLRTRIGPVRRRAGGAAFDIGALDAVLISHLHHDHLDLPSLRRIGSEPTIVAPAGSGKLLASRGFRNVAEVDRGDRVAVGSVTVEAVPARHGGRRLPFGPAGPALGYVIAGEHRIYFAGDTDLFLDMALLAGDLDLAILPVGGWGPTLRGGHLDPSRAAAALTLLQPRWALAVHWGTLWPMGLDRVRRDRFEAPARRFAEAARHVAPGVSVLLLDPGGEIEFLADGGVAVRREPRGP